MVRIRLQRRGRKKLPIYKIVAADIRMPRDGRFIEAIGQYKPLEDVKVLDLDEERALYWLKNGAQPTSTVKNIFSEHGIMLKLHLMRKGKTEDEINEELEKWRALRAEKETNKLSKKQIRKQRKEEEEKKAAAEEAKHAAAEEAKAKAEAPAAEAAAEEPKAEEAPAAEAAAEEPKAEEAPAAEAAAEEPKAEDAPAEDAATEEKKEQ